MKGPGLTLKVRESEVRDIALHGVYDGTGIKGRIEETHISWVILSRHFAFKIKKPLKLSFLDFSTIELRKQQCEKEYQLNSRFSDIYVSVLPIRLVDGQWLVGGPADSAVTDYCVVMKRMALSKRLDNAIRKGHVSERSVKTLGAQIGFFHNKAKRIFSPLDIESTRSTFNDIGSITGFASNNIDNQFGEIIDRAIIWSDSFLESHQARMQQRIDHGLKRDVHGDLHCSNIFLYKKPVLFDCIEFNDQFRQIDVLYEIAFLCMDLEGYHRKHLAQILLDEYGRHFPAFQQNDDHRLFLYFKALRAGIRARVHGMQWSQAESTSEASYHIAETRRYLTLLNEYMASMQSLAWFDCSRNRWVR